MSSEISRVALFGKLNSVGYKSLESATLFCKLRGNHYVEVAHWLFQLVQQSDSDLAVLCRRFELDANRLTKDLMTYIERLPGGATSVTDFGPQVEETVERSWFYASLMFGQRRIRTGHLVVALLKTAGLRHELNRISREFERLDLNRLVDEFNSLLADSSEAKAMDPGDNPGDASTGHSGEGMSPAAFGKQQALQRYAVDLTAKARRGELDPILGRDEEIRQIIDILMRRRQNNPILTGEAGVGKTAVVEGFATRIVAGDVPPSLRNVSVHTLDVGLLQAGASVKGEFESRLRQVIDEVQASPHPIVLFIDEAHTLIGAGGAAGTGDAANLLKPALARGHLRTIAATTWSEYKKYFEKDPALTRRFQVIQVQEPDPSKALLMMRGIHGQLEAHHKVSILDEALEAAVTLSHRYIPARQLPDKAVSLLDTAAARVAIGLHAVPAVIDDCRRKIDALANELAIVGREQSLGIEADARLAELQQQHARETDRLKTWEVRWTEERGLVERILDLRAQLAQEASNEETRDSEDGTELPVSDSQTRVQRLQSLRELQRELAEVQGDQPLITASVDAQSIATVVGHWTGIPIGRMVKNDIESVLRLDATLGERVLGQTHALEVIARRVKTSRANLDNPMRPVGVFLLCGPSGVGKTETALALAETLYGGDQNLITINMSEFQEAHTVSTLKGAPPGYVGYGEGGVLTEAVRRRPYSVVLLDEVEKAHRDVHEIFFQVFDKGWMEDGEGRQINFRNTVILLTSNVGTEVISTLCKDPDLMPNPEGLAKALREPLLKVFPPALLGRLLVVPYYPLTDEMLRRIIRLQLDRVRGRLQDNHRVPFTYAEAAVDLIADRCNEVESGARIVDSIITNTLLPTISETFLTRMLAGETLQKVHLDATAQEFAFEF